MSQSLTSTKNIQSMTGFSRVEKVLDDSVYTIEMRSVNGRFLDLRFKIPSQYSFIESKLKSLAQAKLRRGTVDVNVYVKKSLDQINKSLDDKKIEKFIEHISQLAKKTNATVHINPTDFLRPEFLVDKDESKENEVIENIQSLFTEALEKLVQSRSEEGGKLKKIFEQNIEKYKEHLSAINKQKLGNKNDLEQKLLKKLNEYKSAIPVDAPRFMQEIIYYMEKVDIDEELDRIAGHLTKFEKILGSGGEVGRQIEFLLQELGRETNTIGSKTFQNATSENVVEMKVLLEKLREQGLNVE